MGIKENLKRGTLEMLILELLSGGDKYGYQLVNELNEKSGGTLDAKEGTLYPVLYRMSDAGYITERKELVGKRRIRIFYHAEPAGLAYLKTAKQEYHSFSRGILNIIGPPDDGDQGNKQ